MWYDALSTSGYRYGRAWPIIGQKRPLKPKHVLAIWVRLQLAENHRDLALFDLGIDSTLRGCDLAKILADAQRRRVGNLPLHQRFLQSAPKTLSIGLEKPVVFEPKVV